MSREHCYCGCCGREIVSGTDLWCMDCLREHVDTLARHPWDATFVARFGEPCPYQIETGGPGVGRCAVCGGLNPGDASHSRC